MIARTRAKFSHPIVSGLIWLAITIPGYGQASSRATPEAALETLKKALEAADWKTVAACLAHPKEAKPLVPSALVEAWLRAQSASAELESALRELAEKAGTSNPTVAAQHPLSAYLVSPGEYVLQIIEIEPAGNAERVRARVRCQHRSRGEEETVAVVRLGSQWFVTPPTPLARLFAGMDDYAVVVRRTKALNKLADVLAETARLIRSGQLRDRQAALEHLLRAFHRQQLAELLR